MEEIKELPDFDEWLKNYKPPTPKYLAAYEAETGVLKCVALEDFIISKGFKNYIEIDESLAQKIIKAEIPISKCFIDGNAGKLEIVEEKSLYTMDDVLHRIVEHKWSEFEKADVYVTADTANKMLTVELSEEYGGTKKADSDVVQRKIFWSGDTDMKFMVTEYNDPHSVYSTIDLKLSDILTNKAVFTNIEYPEKFSIYTRRLLDYYEMEIL